jgi:hypothetical protein
MAIDSYQHCISLTSLLYLLEEFRDAQVCDLSKDISSKSGSAITLTRRNEAFDCEIYSEDIEEGVLIHNA